MKLGAEYQISAYTKYSWGDKPNFRIEYYNPDSKKLEEIATAEVKKDRKNYNLTTVKFKPATAPIAITTPAIA